MKLKLGQWNIYFLAKFFLHYRGLLRIDPALNIAFLVLLLLPVKSRIFTVFKVMLGVVLLWQESWLPSFTTAYEFLTNPATNPSIAYAFTFAIQSIPWTQLALMS